MRRLAFQALEDRRLLAADFVLTRGGAELTVFADNTANMISIDSVCDDGCSEDPENPFPIGADTFVTVDDVVRGFEGLTLIHIFGEGGDDVIINNTSIESRMDGGNGNDHLIGGSVGDLLDGGKGNDILEGRGGNDVLFGGRGDDSLFGGEGIDFLWGQLGNNFIDGGGGMDIILLGLNDDLVEDELDIVLTSLF